jgi:putative tricarboxylic transport membrane protein
MRLTYRITGLILLPIALFLGYRAIQLSYYTSIGPGPGFFPLWLCGLLALLAIAMVAQASFGTPEPMPENFFAEASGYKRMAVAVISLFATAVIMPVLGFRATTLIFYLVLLVMLGRRNPIEIIVLAALGSFGVYYLFSRILSQPLPVGLYDW